MIRLLKPFRIIVSLVVLLSIAFIFLDFRQYLPPSWYHTITYLQLVPSIRKFTIAAGILSGGFIIVLLLTLLFGRVYCSMICPLGIFQDIISFFSKKFRRKKFRFKYSKPKNGIRYLFLALAVVPLLFGSITVLGLLDPYSNFGRIFSDLFRPVYLAGNNMLSELLIKMKIYSMSPEDFSHVHLATLLYPIFILALIIWLAVKWGRLYCNSVCPVGTFLGLLSGFSLFKINIDKQSCTKCAKCAFVCKSQCINLKDQSVDFSRCVGCFDCLSSCESNSISYKLSIPVVKQPTKQKPGQPVPAGQGRRKFLSNSVLLAGTLIGISGTSTAQQRQHRHRNRKEPFPVKKEHPCSPPGSVSLEHFNNSCTACHLCVTACPNGVLQPSLLQYGLEGFLQPYMDPTNGYCNFDCTVCGEICPNGAILPLTKEEKQVTQVGVAKFIKHNCVVHTDGTLCGACSEHCPTKAVKMVPYQGTLNIPEVDPEICVGCGACEHACPVQPYKAIYVDGHAVQQFAKKPEIKKAKEEVIEEFPF